MSQNSSEYGGVGGIIQPDVDRVPDANAVAAGLGHPFGEARAVDREGVSEAAMVLRRAALMEARGVPRETIVDPETGVASFVQYTEEDAYLDYVTGENGPVV